MFFLIKPTCSRLAIVVKGTVARKKSGPVVIVLVIVLSVDFFSPQADLYAGALFIKFSFGLSGLSGLYVSILILLALAAFFTIFGGLSAVIW